jgi:hypothetical protein
MILCTYLPAVVFPVISIVTGINWDVFYLKVRQMQRFPLGEWGQGGLKNNSVN